MQYLIILIALFLLELLYFRIADRYNIIDKPNERSSHKSIVIRGGGVLFPFAAVLWWLVNGFQYPYLIVGLLMVSLVSFLDDMLTLSNKVRLLVQFTAAALVLYQALLDGGQAGLVGAGEHFWLWLAPLLIVVVGFKNAFNFMDGINGITALYTFSALAGFYYVNESSAFTNQELLIYIGLSVLVFSFFNVRSKARCFAGDVGSVAIAFLLAFWMVQLIFTSGEVLYLLFFALYGVDSVLTILHRLLKKENIFQAHRSHLYQYMANEMKMSHVTVSLVYFFLQALVNLLVIFLVQSGKGDSWFLLIGALLVLSAVYIISKYYILRKVKTQLI